MKYFNEGHWKNEEMDGEGELNYLNKDKFQIGRKKREKKKERQRKRERERVRKRKKERERQRKNI